MAKTKKKKSPIHSLASALQRMGDGKKVKRGEYFEMLDDLASYIAAQRIRQLKRRKLANYMLRLIKAETEKVLMAKVDKKIMAWLKQQNSLE